MKRLLMSLVGFIMIFILVACGSNTENVEGEDDNEPEVDSWLEEANLDAEETTEELYEKAKEEGEVVIYSLSSRWKDVKEKFEDEFPGIEVKGAKLHGAEMIEKLTREHENDIYESDVVFIKDIHGTLGPELIDTGIVHNYTPEIITENMVEPYKSDESLIPFVSMRVIFYNTDAYSEPPIENWWDLTTPEWEGKVITNDPLASSDTMAVFLTIIENADEMEEAYEEKFGEEIELNGTENAGYEFIKRFMDNDVVLMKSSSSVVEAVATSKKDDAPLGIALSDYMKEVDGQDYPINFSYDVKPRISNMEISKLFVADHAKNVNAAKLLMRSMAGGDDGNSEVKDPFVVRGSWSTREDVAIPHEEQPPLEDVNLWPYNAEFHYENIDAFKDFWLTIQ